jgi:hemerythrin-like metal-binding protein
MAFFEWKDNLSVKVKEIDDQHKALIDMINRLYEAMRTGQGAAIVTGIVDELSSYNVKHFSDVENLMGRFEYPGLSAHQVEHEAFVAKVRDFQNGIKTGKMFLSIDILNFLSDWLRKHIMGTDQKYSEFFNTNGLS